MWRILSRTSWAVLRARCVTAAAPWTVRTRRLPERIEAAWGRARRERLSAQRTEIEPRTAARGCRTPRGAARKTPRHASQPFVGSNFLLGCAFSAAPVHLVLAGPPSKDAAPTPRFGHVPSTTRDRAAAAPASAPRCSRDGRREQHRRRRRPRWRGVARSPRDRAPGSPSVATQGRSHCRATPRCGDAAERIRGAPVLAPRA